VHERAAMKYQNILMGGQQELSSQLKFDPLPLTPKWDPISTLTERETPVRMTQNTHFHPPTRVNVSASISLNYL